MSELRYTRVQFIRRSSQARRAGESVEGGLCPSNATSVEDVDEKSTPHANFQPGERLVLVWTLLRDATAVAPDAEQNKINSGEKQ